MRDMRIVTQEEFGAFLASYPNPLGQVIRNSVCSFCDTSTGDMWPESLVASYLMADPPFRRRPSGWRIPAPIEEPV